jgi:hypothetical protein
MSGAAPRLIALGLGAYLLGSIPFGVIVGRRWKGVDVRQLGSGNIGFANVLRTVGWGPAVVVFVCDTAKGYLPVLAARFVTVGWTYPEASVVLIGVLAVSGHVFPPWLRFRGGRAVLTSLGVLVGIAPWVALAGLRVGGLDGRRRRHLRGGLAALARDLACLRHFRHCGSGDHHPAPPAQHPAVAGRPRVEGRPPSRRARPADRRRP